MKTDLSYNFNGKKFSNCLMNASGARCVTEEELNALGESSAGAIVVKSATILYRTGNPEPRYFDDGYGSLNSMGLPNLGYQKYCEIIPSLKKYGKPVIASVAGFSKQEYLEMVKAFDKAGADIVEINLSCPNIAGKPQVGYDCEQSSDVLDAARKATEKPLTVKLPPFFDIVHREQMAEIIKKTKVDGIVLVNSIGNALIVDAEKEQAVIKPKKGLGGLGGKYIKPITLGNIWSFHELLEGKKTIFGCGGVYSGKDAFEHILCGASLVQIGTHFQNNGVKVFPQIKKELEAIMQKKNYKTIDDFRGKLKEIE